jgi:hypothetical protein
MFYRKIGETPTIRLAAGFPPVALALDTRARAGVTRTRTEMIMGARGGYPHRSPRIDGWAAAAKVTRSEALRRLIEAGLKRRAKQ